MRASSFLSNGFNFLVKDHGKVLLEIMTNIKKSTIEILGMLILNPFCWSELRFTDTRRAYKTT